MCTSSTSTKQTIDSLVSWTCARRRACLQPSARPGLMEWNRQVFAQSGANRIRPAATPARSKVPEQGTNAPLFIRPALQAVKSSGTKSILSFTTSLTTPSTKQLFLNTSHSSGESGSNPSLTGSARSSLDGNTSARSRSQAHLRCPFPIRRQRLRTIAQAPGRAARSPDAEQDKETRHGQHLFRA